jgi:predicted permease
VGIALNLLALPLPKPVTAYIEIIGRAALAAGLLIVGAGLDIRRLARPGLPHLLASGLKLLLMPLLAVTLARLLGVGGGDLVVTIVAASVPTASAAYVLARQMGGNAPVMAEILTLQTLAALVSMPVLIALLNDCATALCN